MALARPCRRAAAGGHVAHVAAVCAVAVSPTLTPSRVVVRVCACSWRRGGHGWGHSSGKACFSSNRCMALEGRLVKRHCRTAGM